MREELAEKEGDRQEFVGTFARCGTKPAFKGPPLVTILLIHVKEYKTGKEVTTHLWFNMTKGFEKLHLEQGQRVHFRARVKKYLKGYKGYDEQKQMMAPLEYDYKLSHPVIIQKLPPEEVDGALGKTPA